MCAMSREQIGEEPIWLAGTDKCLANLCFSRMTKSLKSSGLRNRTTLDAVFNDIWEGWHKGHYHRAAHAALIEDLVFRYA